MSNKNLDTCLHCNSEMNFTPSNMQIFCSRKCQSLYSSVVLTCEKCEKKFQRRNSDQKKMIKMGSKKTFCSRNCYSLFWLEKRKQNSCKQCNKTISQTSWQSKNYRFCSKECKSSFAEKDKNARSFKNGTGIFARIGKEKWGNKCFSCSSQEHIEVHHLDKNRKNNEPENLRPLCRKCHHAVHKGRLSLLIR